MSNGHLIVQIDAAIRVHKAWRELLEEAIETSTFRGSGNEVARDDRCIFGRWLHGDTLSDAVRASPSYETIVRLHADFHRCAADVADLALCGSKSRAKELLENEYARRSDKLTHALALWKHTLH